MSFAPLAFLTAATAAFIAAASAAKAWAGNPGVGTLLLTLALYTAGNLIMLRLIQAVGMAVAFSLSAIVQLVAVNLVALLVFGERLNAWQGTGVVLAIVSVALITLGPSLN